MSVSNKSPPRARFLEFSYSWTRLLSTSNAPILSKHTAVYDDVSDQVFVFGGEERVNTAGSSPPSAGASQRQSASRSPIRQSSRLRPSDRLMTLDLQTMRWSEKRHQHSGSLSISSNSSLSSSSSTSSQSLWPTRRKGHTAVLDYAQEHRVQEGRDGAVDRRAVMYVFGGDAGNECVNDLWAYHPSTNSWSLLETSGDIPSPRRGHCMILGSDRTLFVFGGENPYVGGRSKSTLCDNSVYRLDLHTFQWMIVSSGSGPVASFSSSADDALDADDADDWSGGSPSACPSARYDAVFATLDEHRAVLFGGSIYETKKLNDTWIWSTQTYRWTRTKTLQTPTKRCLASSLSLYMPSRNMTEARILMYGGSSTGVFHSDMWEFSASSMDWYPHSFFENRAKNNSSFQLSATGNMNTSNCEATASAIMFPIPTNVNGDDHCCLSIGIQGGLTKRGCVSDVWVYRVFSFSENSMRVFRVPKKQPGHSDSPSKHSSYGPPDSARSHGSTASQTRTSSGSNVVTLDDVRADRSSPAPPLTSSRRSSDEKSGAEASAGAKSPWAAINELRQQHMRLEDSVRDRHSSVSRQMISGRQETSEQLSSMGARVDAHDRRLNEVESTSLGLRRDVDHDRSKVDRLSERVTTTESELLRRMDEINKRLASVETASSANTQGVREQMTDVRKRIDELDTKQSENLHQLDQKMMSEFRKRDQKYEADMQSTTDRLEKITFLLREEVTAVRADMHTISADAEVREAGLAAKFSHSIGVLHESVDILESRMLLSEQFQEKAKRFMDDMSDWRQFIDREREDDTDVARKLVGQMEDMQSTAHRLNNEVQELRRGQQRNNGATPSP